MSGNLWLPDELKAAIREHLDDALSSPAAMFEAASEDEDTLTGHVFGALHTPKTQAVAVVNSEVAGRWTWKVSYTKFRGRGRGAPERDIGADGIIELSVRRGGQLHRKSALFQAKVGLRGGKPLQEQCARLSTWREAAFVVSYQSKRIVAADIDPILRSRGALREALAGADSLAEYLGTSFLDCRVGDVDLMYDASARRLTWFDIDGQFVATQFAIPHRLRFEVQEPHAPRFAGPVEHIPPTEILNHRMHVEPHDLFGVEYRAEEETIQAAYTQLARTYHPDQYVSASDLLKTMADMRMKEVNVAADLLSERIATRAAKAARRAERNSEPVWVQHDLSDAVRPQNMSTNESRRLSEEANTDRIPAR
jgi:hypothetical protein